MRGNDKLRHPLIGVAIGGGFAAISVALNILHPKSDMLGYVFLGTGLAMIAGSLAFGLVPSSWLEWRPRWLTRLVTRWLGKT